MLDVILVVTIYLGLVCHEIINAHIHYSKLNDKDVNFMESLIFSKILSCKKFKSLLKHKCMFVKI